MPPHFESLPEHFVSIDVECVATGRRHDARAVALVVVVDQDEQELGRFRVKPEQPVASYLTPLTGIRPGELDNGQPLEEVIEAVKEFLRPETVLVGQGIQSDVDWLKLEEGVDFARMFDLATMFKTFNPRFGNHSFFSLSHEANTLLQPGMIEDCHDPAIDAQASIQLFKRYATDQAALERAKQRLLATRPKPSFAKRSGYQHEGMCMAAFMPRMCICDAPSKRS